MRNTRSARPARLAALLSMVLPVALATGVPAAATGGETSAPAGLVTDVDADLAGETITVSWRRPADIDPGRAASYWLRLNGALEWRVRTSDELVQISFPVVDPGQTHEYTVQLVGRSTPVSEPALLAVPAADDMTPPTPPSWEIGFDAQCLSLTWEILEPSVDDTSSESEIRYEVRDFDVIAGQRHIVALDLADAGTGFEMFSALPEQVVLRAVDAAGNRSAPVAGAVEWVC